MPFINSGFACCSVALAIFSALPSVPARADNSKLFPVEAAIPNSRVIHFVSSIDHEPYTIEVSIPLWPAPKTGYPVIYVMDGEVYFPIAAIEADMLGGQSAVVVGIGHDALNDRVVAARYAKRKPGQAPAIDAFAAMDAWSNLRNHDFTWPAKSDHRKPPSVGANTGAEDQGDVDAFLTVIEKEIKPKVAAIVSIDKNEQALFGHSLGGLAVIRALFTEPSAFRSFIAASPSLWYDGGAILAGEKHFGATITSGHATPRVLITNGSLEADSMKTSARDLAARLKALPGKSGYAVDYILIADEDHDPSGYVAVGRAIRSFAFLDGLPKH